jgi:predicted secreted Zn-dependent protease
MKRLANKIFKTISEENGEIPEAINQEIPKYKEIEDHKEAKATMMAYLEETITKVEESIEVENNPKTKKILENAKLVISINYVY